MFNKYEIWYDDKIGECSSFEKAMGIAADHLKLIKEFSAEPDDYQLLQIRCYLWFDRLFRIKGDNYNTIKYTLVVWSELKQKFVINTR